MRLLIQLFVIVTLPICNLTTQSDLNISKSVLIGMNRTNHNEIHCGLISKKNEVFTSRILKNYDRSSHFQLRHLFSHPLSLSNGGEINFRIKESWSEGKIICSKPKLKNTRLSTESYRVPNYTKPTDKQLSVLFLKGEKTYTLEQLEVSHKLGFSAFKVKKKSRNIVGQYIANCIMESLKEELH